MNPKGRASKMIINYHFDLRKRVKSKSKKKGFALGEAAVLIFVIGMFTAASYVGIKKLLKIADVRAAVSEFNQYKMAIIEFQSLYNYYPGDVPLEKIGGSIAGSLSYAQYAESKVTNGELMGDGRIGSMWSSRLAFKQLALGGFIDANVVEMEEEIDFEKGEGKDFEEDDGKGGKRVRRNKNKDKKKYIAGEALNLKNDAGVSFPVTKFNRGAMWYITTETRDRNDKVIAPAIRTDSEIFPKWNSRVTLILSGYKDVTQQIPLDDRDIGAVFPDFAYEVDLKMDDGAPSRASGTVIADNVKDTTNCRTVTDKLIDSIYKETASGPIKSQCVMAFLVD